MYIRDKKWNRVLLLILAGMFALNGCGKVKMAEPVEPAATISPTPTGVLVYEPKSAADLADKTADKLQDLKSVHMALAAKFIAKLDILGTIFGGFGNTGDGDFIPDLGNILGGGLSEIKVSGPDMGLHKTASESDGNSLFSMDMIYDADIQGDPSRMHFYGSGNAVIMGQTEQLPVDAYYFEEEGEHALYTQKDGAWERRIVEMESVSPADSSRFFRAIADGTVNAGLSDMTVEVNGHDTYRLNVTVTGDNIQSILPLIMGPLQGAIDENETLKQLFGSSVNLDGLDDVSLPIRIYIDRETLYPVQMRLEMKEFGNKVLNSLSAVKLDVDTFDTVIDYSLINATSVKRPEGMKAENIS